MSNLAALLQVGDAELHRIAVRSNLSDERVKLLASGATATMPELRALSEALNVPMRAFSDSSSNSQSVEMMFRSAVSEGGSISNDVRIKLSHRVADPISVLSNFQVSKSSWRGAFIKGRQFAEQNAAAFRRLFCKNDQLSPLIRLPQIVERELGLLVLVVNNSAVDGASGYLNGVPFALVAARTFQPRMLFTLAHELGHILLHHDPSMPGVIIDEDIEAHHSSELEREANEFASALLMPSQSVGIALKTARGLMDNTDPELGDLEINFISRIFGVSFGAAALRCERLELLPRGGAAALAAAQKSQGAEMRGRQVGLPPRPEIVFPKVPLSLLTATIDQIRSGEISIGRAASTLQVSIGDLLSANIGGYA